jgi:RNA polymerase sigma factor (sigma-70 family)
MDPANRPAPDSDRMLVEAVLARAPGAFEVLVERYQRLCWHVINRMVRHPQDTQDLCQETFLRVYRHLHQYRFESPLKCWIGQVAYTVTLRHLERRQVAVVSANACEVELATLDGEGDAFDLQADRANKQLLAALHAEIESLPPLQRLVVTLHHLDEMTVPEIGSITGLPEGTVRSHLFRIRGRLRARMLARVGEIDDYT